MSVRLSVSGETAVFPADHIHLGANRRSADNRIEGVSFLGDGDVRDLRKASPQHVLVGDRRAHRVDVDLVNLNSACEH